jgi:hypothetical protein
VSPPVGSGAGGRLVVPAGPAPPVPGGRVVASVGPVGRPPEPGCWYQSVRTPNAGFAPAVGIEPSNQTRSGP